MALIVSKTINLDYMPLAKIVGSELNGKIISISNDDDSELEAYTKTFKHIKISSGMFQVLPNKNAERTVLTVLGSAGSGKSYFISKFLHEYQLMYPTYPIYLFSEKNDDEQLDKLKNLKRIKLSDELAELDYTDFKESAVLFDDSDGLNKPMKRLVHGIRDKLLKLGRAQCTTVISSQHNSTDGIDSKTLLNESQIIVFFLLNYNRSLKYLIENYIGACKSDIKLMRGNKSRWTAYFKSYPNAIVQEKNAWILGTDE